MSEIFPEHAPPAATTPGRAACEAFWIAIGHGPDEGFGPECEPEQGWAWAKVAGSRHAWDAAAQAVLGDHAKILAAVTAQRNDFRDRAGHYKNERDQLRARLATAEPVAVVASRDSTAPELAAAMTTPADVMDAIREMTIDQFGDAIREGTDRLLAEKLPEIQAAAAPELAAAMAETRQLRELTAEILSHFGPTGSGYTARVGQVQIRKWAERAGMEGLT